MDDRWPGLGLCGVSRQPWDGTEEGRLRIYFGSDARAEAILLGCLLAFVMQRVVTGRAGRVWLPTGLGLVLISANMIFQIHAPTTAIVLPSVMGMGSLCVLYAAVNGRGRWLEWGPLGYFGSRSHGIYLYQGPILVPIYYLLGKTEAIGWLIAAPLVLVAAELAWRFVEQPFLRRHRLELKVPSISATSPATDESTVEVPPASMENSTVMAFAVEASSVQPRGRRES